MDKDLKVLMNKYGRKAVAALQNVVSSDRTNASGDTLRSIQYKISGGSIIVEFDPSINIVDEGLNPQNVSERGAEGIVRWMKAKGLRPRFAKGTVTERDYKASAFLIARAIKAKGTIKRFGYRGSNILSVFDDNSTFMNDLSDDIDLYLEGRIEKMFNEMKNK